MTLPLESFLMESIDPPVDPSKLHEARVSVRKALATELKDDLQKRYAELTPAKGEKPGIDGASAGRRRLRNICLGYLAALKEDATVKLCAEQFAEAQACGCMTDKLAALAFLADAPDSSEAVHALSEFHKDADGDALVLNKWFS